MGKIVNIDNQFWNLVKNNLKGRNQNNKMLDTWLDPINFIDSDATGTGVKIKLGVPNKLHQYYIAENLLDRICAEISGIYQKPFEVVLEVTGQQINTSSENPATLDDFINNQSPQQNSQPQKPAQAFAQDPYYKDVLNSDYTFSTFVVGRNNEFAHAACFNVANNPGLDSNPLFISGPVGMGKTHLLNAVGNQIRNSFPNLRIGYVSAERFMNEFVSSIRRQDTEKFRMKYREHCDVLLVDDVQFLSGKEGVQDEFFHTINSFLERKKQVIVACDRMPKDINGLQDRIRSRLEWGLIANIEMPDLETRVAILRYKAEKLTMRLPEDVINYIARISKRSIRELEGNLKKIKMFSELQGLSIEIELAKRVLATHDTQTTITLEDIQKLVADHFKLKVADLKSSTRAKPIVVPRQIAMYLIKKHLDKSLVDIGRSFGGKDHTTVMNALERVNDLQSKDLEIKNHIDELTTRIHNITGV